MPFTLPGLQRHPGLLGPYLQVCGCRLGATHVLNPPICHDCAACRSYLPSVPSLSYLPESVPAIDIN